jgi:hypothetical protein
VPGQPGAADETGVKAQEYNRIRTLVDLALTGRRPRVLPAGTYATIVDANPTGTHYIAEWFNPDPARELLYELLDLGPDDFEVVEDGAGADAERAYWSSLPHQK